MISVCVCLLVAPVSPAESDEPIEMPLGETRVGPKKHVSEGGHMAPPGEYNGTTAAAAMRAVATVAVATSLV